MQDVFTIESRSLPRSARVVGFRGSEGISRLYAFEIFLTLGADDSVDFDVGDLVDMKGTLTLDRDDGRPPFAFHGIFSEASLVHHQTDGRALIRAVLVPQFWRLTQAHRSRIFTKLSIPDVIKETLEDGGLSSDDFTFKLTRSYEPEEHVCQYHESHFDFIARWMEREGLYFYFEQGEEGEKLVITDAKSSHDDLVSTPVRFFALAGADATAKECLETFVCRHRSLPGNVRVKDHDYAKPKLDVSGSASVSRSGLCDVSIHGARLFTPEAAQRLADLRAEQMLTGKQVFTGTGTAFYLRSGYTFQLEDHPRSSFDAKYLAIEVEHYGNQSASTAELRRLTGLDGDDVYRADVTAIPKDVQIRAELRTPWPRVYGNEHGVIDGEADSEYAQLDDHGRYLVRFAFDESNLGDGKASTRVRMMQPHGGGVEGWHFPLRKGTEVLFTFLGGDPDRPVIAGVVPNAHTPSPVTSGNHTRNVIQTGGRNRFELEDKDGFQRITLSTPHANSMIRLGAPNKDHQMIIRTEGATLLDAGQDWNVEVGRDLIENVHGSVVQENYYCEQKTLIAKGREETISAGGMTHDITGDLRQTVEGGQYLTVSGEVTQNCGPCVFHYKDLILTTDGNTNINSTGGKIFIRSPAEIVLDAPKVSNKAGGQWFKTSSFSLELYGMKESFGAQKLDVTGLAVSSTRMKLEDTALSVSGTSVKLETVGTAVSLTGQKIDVCDTSIKKVAMELKARDLELSTGAFASIVKGFLKIG